jgi:23S rRNA (adenine2503-C2)-methyltransferase
MPMKNIRSADKKTEKTLFRLYDGQFIEAVMMRYDRHQTLCISTQVGCAMGCSFCATGQMGFKRQLSSGEIIAQVLYYSRLLAAQGKTVTNVVLMGMGEPFHNYENTLSAIDRLNDPTGYNLGARRFTISTVGIIPSIRRFASEKRQVNLAVSLHAADNDLRSLIIPIAKKYPLDELIAACRDYVSLTNRRITFEWTLIQDVNDNSDQANLLANLINSILCHVNIIPLNPIKGYHGQPSPRVRAEMFRDVLSKYSIPCTLRLRRGIDVEAGCGQLFVGV